MSEPRSTINRDVRTPHDDVVDAWWARCVHRGDENDDLVEAVLADLARQPLFVREAVVRRARRLP